MHDDDFSGPPPAHGSHATDEAMPREQHERDYERPYVRPPAHAAGAAGAAAPAGGHGRVGSGGAHTYGAAPVAANRAERRPHVEAAWVDATAPARGGAEAADPRVPRVRRQWRGDVEIADSDGADLRELAERARAWLVQLTARLEVGWRGRAVRNLLRSRWSLLAVVLIIVLMVANVAAGPITTGVRIVTQRLNGIEVSRTPGSAAGFTASPTAAVTTGTTPVQATDTAAAAATSTATPGGSSGQQQQTQQALVGFITVVNLNGHYQFSGVVHPVTSDGRYSCSNYGTAGKGSWSLTLNLSGLSGDSARIRCYIAVTQPNTLPAGAFNGIATSSTGVRASYTNEGAFQPCFSNCG